MNEPLLTRRVFREKVFARDGDRCVICGQPAVDAHHIMERRLFDDEGYYLSNGASVCQTHHIEAEQTTLSCEAIRQAAGIKRLILPLHLYPDQLYDKWGNPILPNGRRLRGELFEDESVQKILKQGDVLGLFDNRVKYPRTWHLPWSPGVTKDDRKLSRGDAIAFFENREIVITEKMDGENTTLYRDYLHARSTEYTPHASRNWIKAQHNLIAHEIPDGWRICGENLYAKHSIFYDALPSYFLVFSIWNEHNICLSWDETTEYAAILGLATVPVLWRGNGSELETIVSVLVHKTDFTKHEGFVVRATGSFSYRMFREYVAKYVRANHVQTHGGWMRANVEQNLLKS